MKKFWLLAVLMAVGCQKEVTKKPELNGPAMVIPPSRDSQEEPQEPINIPPVFASPAEVCARARLGLDKHGGLILFENLNNQCYMMSALQILLHNGPIFDALCELDESTLKPGSATFLVHKLFKVIYDPDRPSLKPYNARWFADAMKKDLVGSDYTCGWGSPSSFLSNLLFAVSNDNPQSKLEESFTIKHGATNESAAWEANMAILAQGGKSVLERLTRHFKAYPASPAPAILFANAAIKSEDDNAPAKDFKEIINIPGLGDYKLVGVPFHSPGHYWSGIVKDMKTNKWYEINTLGGPNGGPSLSSVSFQYILDKIADQFTSVIALQRADYKMRH